MISDQYLYSRDKDSDGEDDGDETTTSNVSQTKTQRPYKKKSSSHHRHHHISKSSTLPKPLKGILKNKETQQLMIPHVQYNPQLFQDGGQPTMDVLNDPNFYSQFHEMAFINDQQQFLPLNIMNCNRLEHLSHSQQIQCQTLPRHLDVVPFDNMPPCDDCMKSARYKGSYGSECHGTSGAECVFLHNQESLSRTSSIKNNSSSKSKKRMSSEEIALQLHEGSAIKGTHIS